MADVTDANPQNEFPDSPLADAAKNGLVQPYLAGFTKFAQFASASYDALARCKRNGGNRSVLDTMDAEISLWVGRFDAMPRGNSAIHNQQRVIVKTVSEVQSAQDVDVRLTV